MPSTKSSLLQCSLIITTYNWPAALEKVLQSVQWQSHLPNEVLIADDGSDANTGKLIGSIKEHFPVPIKHFWHEDIRKRKTRINNIAITHAAYPYLIFIDHDIVLHPEFVKDHLSLAREGYFINGSRFLADEASTRAFLERKKIIPADLRALEGINSLNKMRVPFLMQLMAHTYQVGKNKIHVVRGCNMSFWKKDLVSVNGYDENYQGWGREDSDIALRLFHKGIKKQSIKFGGIGYHLYHKEANKTDDNKYETMMQEVMKNKPIWAHNGLDQHLS